MQSFKTSDGVEIAYTIDDATPPWIEPETIVLLHPAMGSHKRYFAWIPRLCGHYRVLRWDMRGHGASQVPGPDVPLTMERLVQDLVELLDHTGVKRAHLAGTSAGGYIAQNTALAHPDRVQSLLLFSSTPGLRKSRWPAWLPEVAKVGLRNFLSQNIASRLPVDRLDPKHIEWFLDEADRLDMEFGGRFVTLMSTLDWRERLQDIACPTLLAVPGAANIGNEDDYRVMAQSIPDVQVVNYPGMPHHLTDAVPDRCVDDVLAFLRWRFPKA